MDRTGYVYVLHFERPLSHAQHYIGCTTDPRGRLVTHAHGQGATIVRAALDAGIRFKLGALGTCNMRCMRRIERQIKNWHGAAEFCLCCDPDPRQIPGCRGYPLPALNFPLWSDGLASLEKKPQIEFRMSSEKEPLALSKEIGGLMKEEKHALGFIPTAGDVGITDALIRGRVALCFFDSKLAGYAAFTQSDVVRIHQCVVRDRYRGCGIGRTLIGMVAAARPGMTLQCKVRDDLHANGFWQQIGFRPAGSITHETSGNQLNLYVRFPEAATPESESAA